MVYLHKPLLFPLPTLLLNIITNISISREEEEANMVKEAETKADHDMIIQQ
jgi:hypothetical protein